MQKNVYFGLMKSKVVASVLSIAASLFYVSVVEAAPSGTGSVNASFVRSDRLVLDYSIDGNGSGTAEFSCKVVSPEGKVFNQSKSSSYWSNGKASAQFVFTGLKDSGYYSVSCQWKPYGVGVVYQSVLRP